MLARLAGEAFFGSPTAAFPRRRTVRLRPTCRCARGICLGAMTRAGRSMETLDLSGRRGLVVGIANEHSLAWGAAQHFHNAGAELAVTYLNDKAKPFVEPLAQQLSAPIFVPCNVAEPGQLEAVFDA